MTVENCQIIQFSTAARVHSKRQKPTVRTGTATVSRVDVEQEPERPARDEGALTVTCKNKRLREDRRERWWEANAVREYWKARLQLAGAISSVQRHDLPEGDYHPQCNPDERFAILRAYREQL